MDHRRGRVWNQPLTMELTVAMNTILVQNRPTKPMRVYSHDEAAIFKDDDKDYLKNECSRRYWKRGTAFLVEGYIAHEDSDRVYRHNMTSVVTPKGETHTILDTFEWSET